MESELEKCRQEVIKDLHLKESTEPVIPSASAKVKRRSEDRGSLGRSFSSVGSLRSSREVEVGNQVTEPMSSVAAIGTSTEDHPLVAEASILESKIQWYDGFIALLLECLVSYGYMTSSAVEKLQSLIQSFVKTSKLDSHTSRQLTSIKWIITEELQRNAESSSTSKLLLAGELEQSRQEHLLLLELSKLESESQIKAYQNKIHELQKQLEEERSSHNTSIHEVEKRLRKVMDETIASQKMQEASRMEGLRRQVEDEESKRRAIQSSYREKERHYLDKISSLEEKNITLMQQLEDLELKLTKIKLEGIHKQL
jgi:hypothetical protein